MKIVLVAIFFISKFPKIGELPVNQLDQGD